MKTIVFYYPNLYHSEDLKNREIRFFCQGNTTLHVEANLKVESVFQFFGIYIANKGGFRKDHLPSFFLLNLTIDQSQETHHHLQRHYRGDQGTFEPNLVSFRCQ